MCGIVRGEDHLALRRVTPVGGGGRGEWGCNWCDRCDGCDGGEEKEERRCDVSIKETCLQMSHVQHGQDTGQLDQGVSRKCGQLRFVHN